MRSNPSGVAESEALTVYSEERSTAMPNRYQVGNQGPMMFRLPKGTPVPKAKKKTQPEPKKGKGRKRK